MVRILPNDIANHQDKRSGWLSPSGDFYHTWRHAAWAKARIEGGETEVLDALRRHGWIMVSINKGSMDKIISIDGARMTIAQQRWVTAMIREYDRKFGGEWDIKRSDF